MFTDVSANLAVATLHLTLKMTTAKVVETSVNINNDSPSQDSTNLDDLHLKTCKDTPGFKPFTLLQTVLLFK